MSEGKRLYSVWIYDEESGCEQPMRCLAEDESEAKKKGESYIFAWDLKGGEITKIEPCKLQLGELYTTAGVSEKMQSDSRFAAFVHNSVNRFVDLDWGDTCEEDVKINDEALESGDRILSVYKKPRTGEKIWIITEADRSVTTVLFPDEY